MPNRSRVLAEPLCPPPTSSRLALFESSVVAISQQFEQFSQRNGWLERLSVGCQRARHSDEREEEGGRGGEGSESGGAEDYRGTSLIRNTPLLGPYSRTIPRVL